MPWNLRLREWLLVLQLNFQTFLLRNVLFPNVNENEEKTVHSLNGIAQLKVFLLFSPGIHLV